MRELGRGMSSKAGSVGSLACSHLFLTRCQIYQIVIIKKIAMIHVMPIVSYMYQQSLER